MADQQLSPMMQHYMEKKEEYKDCIPEPEQQQLNRNFESQQMYKFTCSKVWQ